jgi:uncharacterized protein YxjI
MIIEMIQTRSFTGADFVFSTNSNENLYTAQVRFDVVKPNINLMQDNETILALSSENINVLKESFKREPTFFEIIKPNGETCGKISSKFIKTFLFFGRSHTQITYNSEVYDCYVVGKGKEGTFVCIYSGEQQIALIEKHTVVYDNKDTYTLYIKDDKHAELICLFATYYDHSANSNYNEYAANSKKVNYYYTYNKELNSKYNPQFKELCR